ncbi:hypothetical protein L210DRAFT_3494828 [Boletus edulis BED1]|uniref:Uncharacterized protein n=1 Tax=Boletus edulis BED1 TaxID=1328754 RepID=A0AAD4G6D5_BOLED|nr:hypothetical protein L210DRAFT_3494828 [Boletus edulis BED1]
MMDDLNPRPQKRQRTDYADSAEGTPLPPSSMVSESPQPLSTFRPLPPPVLLLALPALLALPPSHEHYSLSLFLSLRALRTCLELRTLTPDVECRAWTGLAEVGLRVINSGFTPTEEHAWANGIEAEVEKAIGKGLLIAQKHPALRPLRHHLSLLNAQFAFRSNNTKYARALLRRLIASFMSSDPPSVVYIAHLALITHLTSSPSPAQDASNSTAPSAPELQAALSAITALSGLATQNKHPAIEDLAAVLRVRILVGAGLWDLVDDALSVAEKGMQLVFHTREEKPGEGQECEKANQDTAEILMRSYSITAKDVHSNASSQSQSQTNGDPTLTSSPPKGELSIPGPKATDALTLALTAQLLILGVIFHTHAGRARATDARLAALHALMDGGALVGGANSDGLVEIPLPGHNSIFLQTTHPHILYLLTFLISAAAKRDPVSRRPKKRVFAECGVVQCREGRLGKEGSVRINVPLWASYGDVTAVEQHAFRIEADLLCELVTVSIQRSNFEAAESHLATLIAHTRTHDLFLAYAARITLLHAHLAHALGDPERAGTSYRVAARLDGASPVGSGLAPGGGFIAAAARVSEALLRIGLSAMQPPPPSSVPDEQPNLQLDASTTSLVKDALARCSSGASAPLPALGELISAAMARPHIIRSKSLLKHALELLSAAGDNHLRALVLAVVGAQYVYTAPTHAMEVLAVCETLGAGMGANPKKQEVPEGAAPSDVTHTKDGIGNAPLRLWVGERFLELFKRAGKENRARKQEAFNAVYQAAVDDFGTHRARLW